MMDSGLIHASLEATFKRRIATKGRDSDEYRRALQKRTALAQLIAKLIDDQKLDALAYPTIRRKPARINDPQGGSTCQLSASTGFPAISIPAGFTADGLPVGIELLGRAFDDAKLVSLAYAYEQATHHRKAPSRTPALGNRLSVPLITWQATAPASISARFTFDPSTSELSYTVTSTSEMLAATLHRIEKNDSGPAIFLLSNRPFKSLSGKEMLSNPDREKLLSGDLYIRVATRPKYAAELHIRLKPQ